ncbi:MAG: hypothetical protein UU21_C0001G0128 [Candidatus Levybacteria bacterium GW2011_GWA2_40_8]|nr:MAG: hypothetical protein UU21_C0001G0128 [Candidatus Levybacteria bacterium GW2011_GWA2_40_8]
MNVVKKYLKKGKIKKVSKLIGKNRIEFLLIFLIVIASFLFGVLSSKLVLLKENGNTQTSQDTQQAEDLTILQNKVLKDKYVFKIVWKDLGKKMVQDGVIDKAKLAQAVTGEDKLPKEFEKYFDGKQDKIELTLENSRFWVDVLWGLGLANKNAVLEEGEMMAEGDASGFASTGGWTLGKLEDAMNYYSKYSYINLSEKQQETVVEIAGNIYRPCCGNSTAFPDCNHGMAMLGLIELMVSQNFSENEIYKAALAFNTYWFPQTYLDTAYYLKQNGRDYEEVSPKELLSKDFSSAMGYQTTSENVGSVEWPALGSGGSCGA